MDRRFLRLLILLYDISRDALTLFFKCRICHELTPEKITQFIEDHKLRLFNHMTASMCHLCTETDNRQGCVSFNKEQFDSLYINDANVDKAAVARHWIDRQISLEDIDITKLQYLVLAGDIELKEHQLVLELYKQRRELSKSYNKDINEEHFDKIWDTTRRTIIDLIQTPQDRFQADMVVKQLNYLKMIIPQWDSTAQKYRDMMQLEFYSQCDIDVRKQLVTKNDDNEKFAEIVEKLNLLSVNRDNADKVTSVIAEQLSLNIHANNVMIGNNNSVNDVIPNNITKQLKDIMDRLLKEHSEIIVEKIQNCLVFASLRNVPSEKSKSTISEQNESEKLEAATSGMQDDKKTSRVEPRNADVRVCKCYTVEWTLKLTENINTEEMIQVIQSMKSIEIMCGGNIIIKFVHRGSIVIGTIVAANIIENKSLRMEAVKRFLTAILTKCKIDITSAFILEVDINVGRLVEDDTDNLPPLIAQKSFEKEEELSSGVAQSANSCPKCIEKTSQIKELQAHLKEKENDEANYAQFLRATDSMVSTNTTRVMDPNRTIYSNADLEEIKYANFPYVKVRALHNYTHMVEDQRVVFMKVGDVYYLIKRVGEWSEIIESAGPQTKSSFFVLSKYTDIITDDSHGEPLLTPYRQFSLKQYGDFRKERTSREEYKQLSGTAPAEPLKRRLAKRLSKPESTLTVLALEQRKEIRKNRSMSYPASKTN